MMTVWQGGPADKTERSEILCLITVMSINTITVMGTNTTTVTATTTGTSMNMVTATTTGTNMNTVTATITVMSMAAAAGMTTRAMRIPLPALIPIL